MSCPWSLRTFRQKSSFRLVAILKTVDLEDSKFVFSWTHPSRLVRRKKLLTRRPGQVQCLIDSKILKTIGLVGSEDLLSFPWQTLELLSSSFAEIYHFKIFVFEWKTLALRRPCS